MLFVAGCSKNDPQASDENAWVHDLSLPVPIQFGSPFVETKAKGYESVADLNGIGLVVYGIAKDVEFSNWTTTQGALLLYNESATIEQNAVKFSTTHYYPRISDHSYSFYGYHPQDGSPTVDENYQAVVVPITDLGTKDILWAKAEAKGEDGYNAQYMRDIRSKTVDDAPPSFNFKHVTAGLKFIAVANIDSEETTDNDFVNIKIKEVIVGNVPSKGLLSVAGKDEGKIVRLSGARALSLDGLGDGVAPTADGTLLGELFPYPGDGVSYDVTVKVNSPAFDDYTVTFNTGNIIPGKQYIYKLKFNKMDTVEIQVTGLDWEEGSDEFEVDTDSETPSPTPVSGDDNQTEEPGEEDSGSDTP